MTEQKRLRFSLYIDADHLDGLEVERQRRIRAGAPRSEAALANLINEAIGKLLHPDPVVRIKRGIETVKVAGELRRAKGGR
jgi:hypothetical protein